MQEQVEPRAFAREERMVERFQRQLRNRVVENVALREQIIAHLGCSDCGAPAGKLCRPEYGCSIESRVLQ